jgi:hypothetical protein
MPETCQRCHRPILYPLPTRDVRGHGPLVKVYVVHAFYGCDTGCCGHIVVAQDAQGNECQGGFEFMHPYEDDPQTWAQSLANHEFPGVEFSWEDCAINED